MPDLNRRSVPQCSTENPDLHPSLVGEHTQSAGEHNQPLHMYSALGFAAVAHATEHGSDPKSILHAVQDIVLTGVTRTTKFQLMVQDQYSSYCKGDATTNPGAGQGRCHAQGYTQAGSYSGEFSIRVDTRSRWFAEPSNV